MVEGCDKLNDAGMDHLITFQHKHAHVSCMCVLLYTYV